MGGGAISYPPEMASNVRSSTLRPPSSPEESLPHRSNFRLILSPALAVLMLVFSEGDE